MSSALASQNALEELAQHGISAAAFDQLLDDQQLNPSGYLGSLVHEAAGEFCDGGSGVHGDAFQLLLSLSEGYNHPQHDIDHSCWLDGNLVKALGPVNGEARSATAELDAYGHLRFLWSDLAPLPCSQSHKTPDFSRGDDLYVEVYCPQVADTSVEKIGRDLASAESGGFLVDSEVGSGVSIAITAIHPVIGEPTVNSKNGERSDPLSFPANKTIDRVLSGKRDNDQFVEGKQNILWLDLKHGIPHRVQDILPLVSVNKAEQTHVGSVGVWHAFYGDKGVSSFFKERSWLRFNPCGSYLMRDKQGLFRERRSISAAVVSCVDGNILLENPWAARALAESTRSDMLRIFRFRPEYSWLAYDGMEELRIRIYSALSYNEWLINSGANR